MYSCREDICSTVVEWLKCSCSRSSTKFTIDSVRMPVRVLSPTVTLPVCVSEAKKSFEMDAVEVGTSNMGPLQCVNRSRTNLEITGSFTSMTIGAFQKMSEMISSVYSNYICRCRKTELSVSTQTTSSQEQPTKDS